MGSIKRPAEIGLSTYPVTELVLRDVRLRQYLKLRIPPKDFEKMKCLLEEHELPFSCGDAPIPFDGLPGAPVTSVTIPQGDQHSWWLRRFAHLDNCGDLGLPLPQARVRADYDDPPGDRSLSSRLSRKGPGRRYVSELG